MDTRHCVRRSVVLLLCLEILVAADLIRTAAVSPTLQSVTVLGLIVLIRTFLSFSLQIEIGGAPPWQRVVTSGATTVVQAARTPTGRAHPEAGAGRGGWRRRVRPRRFVAGRMSDVMPLGRAPARAAETRPT
ncbi:DUF1622 domain-containing protein [Dactylosporangium sp. NPDC049525]|uniref:DUF1622 domain-containing protein n=1 Tax=Dactylosporangium sp. NPDC049525 TaxID=3154730 RepID=UPI00344AB072